MGDRFSVIAVPSPTQATEYFSSVVFRSPLNNVGVIPGKLAIPPEDGSASG